MDIQGQNEDRDFLKIIPWFNEHFSNRDEDIKLIGKGDFGKVFSVFHKESGKKMALKIMKCDDLKEFEEMCERILNLKQLNHPGVIKISEHFFYSHLVKRSETYFEEYAVLFSMELAGESLEQKIIRIGKMNSEGLIEMMTQILSALEYTHKRNIVHGGIKPQNILIFSEEMYGEVRFPLKYVLSDWVNTKKNFPSQANLSNEPIFSEHSLHYSAPEILKLLDPENADSDHGLDLKKSDIYSLGLVLLKCVGSSQIILSSLNKCPEEFYDEKLSSVITEYAAKFRRYGSHLWQSISAMLQIDPKKRRSADFLKTLFSSSNIKENSSEKVRINRIYLLGDLCSGKTSFLDKVVKNTFIQPTLPTLGVYMEILKKGKLKFQIHETPGREKLRSLLRIYLEGNPHCLLLCRSQENADESNDFIKYMREKEVHTIYLVQTMSDLGLNIDFSNLINGNPDLKFRGPFSCSAKTGENINFVIDSIIDEIVEDNLDESSKERDDLISLKSDSLNSKGKKTGNQKCY